MSRAEPSPRASLPRARLLSRSCDVVARLGLHVLGRVHRMRVDVGVRPMRLRGRLRAADGLAVVMR